MVAGCSLACCSLSLFSLSVDGVVLLGSGVFERLLSEYGEADFLLREGDLGCFSSLKVTVFAKGMFPLEADLGGR